MNIRHSMYYVLDGHTPVPCGVEEWARRYEDRKHRQVARDENNVVLVSTVFLGLNHSFRDDDPPILFETMIFGGPHDEEQWRYSTWDEAVEGHKKACKLAFPKEQA